MSPGASKIAADEAVPLDGLKSALGLLQRDYQRLLLAVRAHDFGTATEITLEDLAAVLAKAGVPYAGVVSLLLPTAFALARKSKPADPSDPAMQKAAGPDNTFTGA